jgi:hypothetical protein
MLSMSLRKVSTAEVGSIIGKPTENIKSVMKKAKNHFRENLQTRTGAKGTIIHKPIHRKEIGDLEFPAKSLDETLYMGSDYDRIKLIPYLSDIAKYGEISERTADDGSHPNIDHWYYIRGKVAFENDRGGIEENIGMLDVAVDKNGNKFYFLRNITTKIKRNGSNSVQQPTLTVSGMNIAQPRKKVKANFSEEEVPFVDTSNIRIDVINERKIENVLNKSAADFIQWVLKRYVDLILKNSSVVYLENADKLIKSFLNIYSKNNKKTRQKLTKEEFAHLLNDFDLFMKGAFLLTDGTGNTANIITPEKLKIFNAIARYMERIIYYANTNGIKISEDIVKLSNVLADKTKAELNSDDMADVERAIKESTAFIQRESVKKVLNFLENLTRRAHIRKKADKNPNPKEEQDGQALRDFYKRVGMSENELIDKLYILYAEAQTGIKQNTINDIADLLERVSNAQELTPELEKEINEVLKMANKQERDSARKILRELRQKEKIKAGKEKIRYM